MKRGLFAAVAAAVLAGLGLPTIASNGRATARGTSMIGQFFLPTGTPRNVGAPRIAADRTGALHLVYPAFTRGDAFYAYCPGACHAPADARVVRLPTDATVTNAMIAVTPQGRPQLLLSTFQRIYYAACTGDCTVEAGWTVTPILEHRGRLEVSGAAFAVTADGRPRAMVHSFRNLGLPGADAGTWYLQCDARCTDQAGWRVGRVSRQVWEEASLKLDAGDRPRLVKAERTGGDSYLAAYASCDDDCSDAAHWRQTPLAPVHHYLPDTVPMRPAVALALTSAGRPRVAMIARLNGAKALLYTECDVDCLTRDRWQAQVLVGGRQGESLKAGVDIAVDVQGRPRLVYTANWSILLAACDRECTNEATPGWSLARVEGSGDMAPDRIIPYSNCDVSAWFVHSPSLALDAGGTVRTAYRAQDISGGGWRRKVEPRTTPCSAGPDMTFARLARTVPATR